MYLPIVVSIKGCFSGIRVVRRSEQQPRLDKVDKQGNERCDRESEDRSADVSSRRTRFRRIVIFQAAVAHGDISGNHRTAEESVRSNS